ncbi:hypothetical protein [Leifsonia sp. NPDC077715]|uniref:hypothetical protein n=1 Tax=Leifsonia sp. NPDC077715 TaxID=3155539 RepID=UPI003432CCCD
MNHRPRWLRRAVGALAIAALAVVAGVGAATPAQADDTWTWNTATHPAGAGAKEHIGWGTTGGGIYRYHGVTFVPTAGHVAQPLGSWMNEGVTGSGTLGRIAYTTYADGRSQVPDIGLTSTGTKPIEPKLRVSDGWQDAMVMDVAHPGDVLPGGALCHSGTSAQTMAEGGYRCGEVRFTCAATSTYCYTTIPVSGGDSGGPVWWYSPGGIKLYGWVVGHVGDDQAVFVPVWTLQNHVWTEGQSWSSWGYPPGNDGTGCFVTVKGCIRS